MGDKDLCSVTADQNKILIITSQATIQVTNLLVLWPNLLLLLISSNTTEALVAHFNFTFYPSPFVDSCIGTPFLQPGNQGVLVKLIEIYMYGCTNYIANDCTVFVKAVVSEMHMRS